MPALQNPPRRHSIFRTPLLSTAVTLVFACSASAAVGTDLKTTQPARAIHTAAQRSPAANPNPGIAPINSSNHGRTYGEWTAAWWQWALSIPLDRNPNNDLDGRYCAENQSGPMWFLASTPSFSTTRYCTIPAGRSLFLNVSSVIDGAGVFDCDPTVPGVACDVEKLRALAAEYLPLYAEVMVVKIDGRLVENIRQYHAIASQPFSVTYPANSLIGVPAGVYYPQVAESYSLIINPLPRGVHRIEIHAESTAIGFNWDLIYRITID